MTRHAFARYAAILAAGLLPMLIAPPASAKSAPRSPLAPSGLRITPLAAAGARFVRLNPHLRDFPGYTAGQAVSTAVSPDGKTLLILTSGYNRLTDAGGKTIPSASNEYVFVFDIAKGAPRQVQALQIPDSYMGLAFAPDGRHFYVSGGMDDDVHVFAAARGRWAEDSTALVKLGHAAGKGLEVKPEAGGLAVSGDRLVVADFYNDALSLVPLANGLPSGPPSDIRLQPGSGKTGGTYPFWVAVSERPAGWLRSCPP